MDKFQSNFHSYLFPTICILVRLNDLGFQTKINLGLYPEYFLPEKTHEDKRMRETKLAITDFVIWFG
jgi:hypothetical protein